MNSYIAGFWNVENYFAPEGFEGRVDWLAKKMKSDLTGWTPALFDRKTQQLARAIAAIGGGGGPDLLGVCEVENRYVLEQLIAALQPLLPARSYAIVHADNTRDQRGIDTAFLYDSTRMSVRETEVFSHFVMRRTGTRDITQATFVTNAGNELVALSNHWPSRSGGAAESAGFRQTAGETLGYWHERIRQEKGKDVAVIALGDFNDDIHDPSITRHANASRVRGEITRSTSARFLNLSWEFLEQRVTGKTGRTRDVHGTIYYKGKPNLFDQILASRGLLTGANPLTVVPQSAQIDALPAMIDTSLSRGPIRFGLPKGKPEKNINEEGFSDHFPVSVEIREAT